MNYEALRAVFRRANALLGSNWSIHDLRHTAALRMARDDALSLRDVQTILGHAHLSTTADVCLVGDEEKVISRVASHLASGRTARQRRYPMSHRATSPVTLRFSWEGLSGDDYGDGGTAPAPGSLPDPPARISCSAQTKSIR